MGHNGKISNVKIQFNAIKVTKFQNLVLHVTSVYLLSISVNNLPVCKKILIQQSVFTLKNIKAIRNNIPV